ncbi:MAG: YhcH/YjgK/YiaL family protein [Oscillospiraceae bacterium]|nr:YhcH/YjgK/YiaL family protein [Oscillospiraceae bacterium]
MIIDKIENLSLYFPVLEGLPEAARFLSAHTDGQLEPGRYDIDGDRMFALAQSYTTKPFEGAQFEAHRKYADLQAVTRGGERIGWAPLETLTETSEEFSKGGDIAFYSGDTVINADLREGYFALLFPHDAHMPCLHIDGPGHSEKIVIKIQMP